MNIQSILPKLSAVPLVTLLALLALATPLSAQNVPSLVNYQGRLSNPDGSPLPTADYTLTFKIYDAATNGSLVWGPQLFDGLAAQGHGGRVPVVQGYFNVMLGPVDTNGTALSEAFNGAARYVEIAVSNRPPIAPRQQILTTPFAFQAANSAKLAGYDWSVVFGTNHPMAGPIPFSKLGQRQVGTNVGLAGVAVSQPVLQQTLTTANSAFYDITNLSLTIQTSGRPLVVFLTSASLDNTNSPSGIAGSFLHFIPNAGNNVVHFRLLRDGGAGAIISTFGTGAGGAGAVGYPTQLGPLLDFPPAGMHTYQLQWGFVPGGGNAWADIHNVRLVAFEL